MTQQLLTPALVRAAYSLLHETRPFNRWGLPDSDEIEYRVTRRADEMGALITTRNGRCILAVSSRWNGTLHSLLETVAHEMIHMRLGYRAGHGPRFQRCARLVCKHHPFDLKRL